MSDNKENYNINLPINLINLIKTSKKKKKKRRRAGLEKKKIRHNRRSVERRKRNPKRIADVPG